jgi:putative hydrolase of the HAD superfamily
VTVAASRRFDAITFDFYGTLADAPGFELARAHDVLLAALGLDVERGRFTAAYRLEVERYFRDVAARGDEQHNTVWVAAALAACGIDVGADDARVRAAVRAYFELYARELRVLDGVRPALERLERHYRLAVLSNFTDPLPVRATLGRDGLGRLFQAVVISAEVGRRKPHRAIFDHAVAALGCRPERTLHVGDDAEDDVRGARAAGLATAWLRAASPPLLAREFTRERAAGSAGGAGAGAVEADFTVNDLGELAVLLLDRDEG